MKFWHAGRDAVAQHGALPHPGRPSAYGGQAAVAAPAAPKPVWQYR